MNDPSSSSSIAATITTVEAAAATAAVLMTVDGSEDREKLKNHDTQLFSFVLFSRRQQIH